MGNSNPALNQQEESKGRSPEGHCPISPPPSTCTTFSDVEIQDLKVSLELKILYILYDKKHQRENTGAGAS